MPRLHQYRNRSSCYVLTSIRGTVVTFQLTSEGEAKLKGAGVTPEQTFPRALLLDLYRSGDAYTGGGGVSEPSSASLNQLELDFAQDPDPETSFPSCEDCGGVDDLHLSIVRDKEMLTAKLQCPSCRDKASAAIDTCVPVRVLSLPLLGKILDMKSVKRRYESVKRFEELLRTNFEAKWDAIRKQRGASQEALFASPGELNLTPTKRRKRSAH